MFDASSDFAESDNSGRVRDVSMMFRSSSNHFDVVMSVNPRSILGRKN